MKDELNYIGKKIIQNNDQLAGSLIDLQDHDYRGKLEKTDVEYNQLIEWRSELIKYLGTSLFDHSESNLQKIEEWGMKIGDFSIRNHIPLSDTLRALTFYRTVIWEVFSDELEKQQFAAITMLDVSKIIDPLLDKLSNIFGSMYEENSNRLMKIAYTALEELSVPVVPIDKGIAIIPIIGEIDTHRARLIMEVSLNESYKLNVNHLIMDVSGVLVIDTMVADQIIKIIQALKLTGVKTILTGIRPEIAQTISRLGIRFNEIKTYASLRHALNDIKN